MDVKSRITLLFYFSSASKFVADVAKTNNTCSSRFIPFVATNSVSVIAHLPDTASKTNKLPPRRRSGAPA